MPEEMISQSLSNVYSSTEKLDYVGNMVQIFQNFERAYFTF